MPRTIYTDGNNIKAVDLNSLLNWEGLGNMPWAGANDGTPATAYRSGAFLYRCVDVRANAISALPWAIYRGETELASNDADMLPEELAFLGDIVTLLYRTEVALCLDSRAYWLKLRNRVRLLNLQWLDPSTMEPVWTPQGIGAFKRKANANTTQLPAGDVVYIWLKGTSETEPRIAPARAALNAANVLISMDAFVKAFFDRGAIKGTILQVEGNPPKAEKEKLRDWWKRTFGGGSRTAWEAEVVSSAVTPIVIGEGVAELGNSPLTVEKREDIATAMGVPHSLVLSNASNFATSEADRLNFYDQTVLPSATLIQKQVNEQLFMPLGLRFEFLPDSLPVYQADEQKQATAFASYVGAGIKPSIVAQMLAMELPEGIEFDDLDPEPQPVELVAEAGNAPNAQQREEEEARFKRWATKRKAPDVSAFKSDILSDAEKEALLGTGAIPFEFPDGTLTPEAYKALLLQLDPDDEDAPQQVRVLLEGRTEREIRRAMDKWLRDSFHTGMTNAEVEIAALGITTPQELRDAIQRGLINASDLGVSVALDTLGQIGMAFDWTLVHTAARDWADRYVGELIAGIESTTRRMVQQSVARWVQNGEGLPALIDSLAPAFGTQRASLIASTEVTRAFAEATRIAYDETGVVSGYRWDTARDERVCPICGPLHGQIVPKGQRFQGGLFPPAHPRCRCGISGVVMEPDDA